MSLTASLPPKRYTRKSGAQLIRETFGIPFTESRFDKDAMEKDDRPRRAPKPDAVYGKIELYSEEKILAYGKSLIREVDRDQSEAA